VAEIDEQHQKILELVNDLHSAVESCIDKEALRIKLIALVEFTDLHFSTEDQLMEKYNYPGIAPHQREHRSLIGHLKELVKAVSNGKSPVFYSDYDVSTDWALTHIRDCDRNLGIFLNSKGVY
jgi:hemerythrin-like metal-binding protein